MKYKIIIILPLLLSCYMLFKPNVKEEKINKDNISIFIETNDGVEQTNSFPEKDYYSFQKLECDNLNKETKVNAIFNEETWKLNFDLTSINKEKGNFKCQIYFKEKDKRTIVDTLITKYTENNNEGLIKLEQPATVQTKATTEYRYSGENPKNYVNFNNETWRIIGIFDVENEKGKIEKRAKIIKETSIGNYSWDSSPSNINSGTGSNQWGNTDTYLGSDLMQELNDTYYNSKSGTCYNNSNNASTTCNFETTGLKEESRKMISDAIWYTGTSASNSSSLLSAKQTYINERSNLVGGNDSGQNITKTKNWLGKIALMYASDYGYASSCYISDSALWHYANCANSNWLFNNIYEWTITPFTSNSNVALLIFNSGGVDGPYVSSAYEVRPSLYLKPTVKITKGYGTKDEPYNLST